MGLHFTPRHQHAALLRDTRPFQSGPRLLRPVLEAAAPRARLRAVSLSHNYPPSIPTSPIPSPTAPTPSPLANASTSATAPRQTPTRGTPYVLASPEDLPLPSRRLGLSPVIGRACTSPLAPAHGASGIATPAFVSASPTALQAAGRVGDVPVVPALFALAPAPAAVSCSPASQNTRALP